VALLESPSPHRGHIDHGGTSSAPAQQRLGRRPVAQPGEQSVRAQSHSCDRRGQAARDRSRSLSPLLDSARFGSRTASSHWQPSSRIHRDHRGACGFERPPFNHLDMNETGIGGRGIQLPSTRASFARCSIVTAEVRAARIVSPSRPD
jgi:hypothetical protein